MPLNIKKLGGMFLVWLVCHASALAAIITNAWVPVFRGVDYTTAEADEPRLQKVFAFRVDLHDPTIEFFSTPSNGARAKETDGQSTTAFVNTYKLAVGINANFFSPVSTKENEPRDLLGLAMSRGSIVSPPIESNRPVALISRENSAIFRTPVPTNYTNYWTAVAGSHRVLINGIPRHGEPNDDPFFAEHPRSALGTSADGRYFYMMVIDGRRAGWSEGATLYETGQWLLRLGAWNGLNLDGGGSTALARMQNGSAVMVNKTSGSAERVNGNHLGVFAQPLPPVILSQPKTNYAGLGQSAIFSVSASGGEPLRYQWRLNGANIASATNSIYTRNNLLLSHFGYYSVVITNEGGLASSINVPLVCTNAPTTPYISKVQRINGMTLLDITAEPARIYSIQASSNFIHWTNLMSLLVPQGGFQWVDTSPTEPLQRFYRIRWEAPK